LARCFAWLSLYENSKHEVAEKEQKRMSERRWVYIDYIRLAVIALVIVVHTAITYSGVGSWYYKDAVTPSRFDMLLLIFIQSFSQSAFMGLLFLLAGYMVPLGLDKKGTAFFLRDRMMRLGIPALFYMLAINPFIQYFLLGKPSQSLMTYFLGGQFINASGPLWFALALLGFSLVYAIAVHGIAFCSRCQNRQTPFSFTDIVALSLGITVGAFLIRLVQPIGSSIFNMQIGNFVQYIVFFVVGTRAARGRLLNGIDYLLGVRCLQAAFIPGLAVWLLLFFFAGTSSNNAFNIDAIKGGFNMLSFAYAFWESTNGVLISFGVLAVCREKFNKPNRLLEQLADSSFAVYVFHSPILVAVSLWVAPLNLSLWGKFLSVSLISLFVSFFLANTVLNRIPVFRTKSSNLPAKLA